MKTQAPILGGDCAEAKRWLPMLPDLDGDDQPDAAIRARLEAHLVRCAACTAQAEAYRRAAELVRRPVPGAERLPAGAAFVAALRVQEQQPNARRVLPSWLIPWRWPAGIALAGLVLLVSRAHFRPQKVAPSAPSRTSVATSLPALIVIDDERSGREVMVTR